MTTSSTEGAFIQAVNGTGTLLTISQIQNGAVVAVLSVSLSNTTAGAYTVTQLAAIDHPAAGTEDNLQFTVGYVATDGDGDTATGSLSIDVDDDRPTVSANLAAQLDDDALGAMPAAMATSIPTPPARSGYSGTAMAPTAPARRC